MSVDDKIIDLGKFEFSDQQAFAEVSGDFNPLHLDAMFARKTIVGVPVVHGMHLVVRLLEKLGELSRIENLNAMFQSPARVGEELQARVSCLEREDGFRARIERRSTGKVLATVECVGTSDEFYQKNFRETSIFQMTEPNILASVQPGLSGEVRLSGTMDGPSRSEYAGGEVRLLMAISTIVGMRIPGLHSLLAGVKLKRADHWDAKLSDRLRYEVKAFDGRFGMVTIGFEGVFQGEITAFVRPHILSDRGIIPPIRKLNEQRALVIGGSRGIGSTCVRMLANSGANVKFTWARGKIDAEVLVSGLSDSTGVVETAPFDIYDFDDRVLKDLVEWRPDSLYFFATPFIFEGDGVAFRDDLFEKFTKCYVTGFTRLVEKLMKAGVPLKRVFYPSSVAIDNFPADMAEYTAAKSSGEVACRYLEQRYPSLRIFVPRLPRTETAQTVSVTPVKNADAITILKPLLENFANDL